MPHAMPLAMTMDEMEAMDAAPIAPPADADEQQAIELPQLPRLNPHPLPEEAVPQDVPLPPQDIPAAAIAAVAVGEHDHAEGPSVDVEESMKKLQDQQNEQSQLIVSMQNVINGLAAKQTLLEEEVKDLRGGRWVVKHEPPRARITTMAPRRDTKDRVVQAEALLSVGGLEGGPLSMEGTTEDAEIDSYIELRKERKLWPLKRKYCTSFTQEVDLLKIRFHRSDAHEHKSVRIPKVDKNEGYGLGNREGRLICRLCSGKTINRNTSWMCATCCVPLCVDIVNGDPESSCHARWHNCHDLVAVNATLNTALRERRESKKRSREAMDSMEDAQHHAIEQQQQHHRPQGVTVAEAADVAAAVEVPALGVVSLPPVDSLPPVVEPKVEVVHAPQQPQQVEVVHEAQQPQQQQQVEVIHEPQPHEPQPEQGQTMNIQL